MKTRSSYVVALLVAVLSLSQTSRLFSQTLGVDTLSGTTGLVSGNGGLTLGWDFQVTAPQGIMVNGLAFWDSGADGFGGQTFPVGLWSLSNNSLLAQSVITSSSTLVPSLDTGNGWRVNSISPLFLAQGSYVIGALFPVNGANGILGPGTFQAAPGINLTGFVRQIGSPTLAMPDIGPPFPTAIWFGPTFTFSPVPEPGSVVLVLAGLSLMGARLLQRKYSQTSTSAKQKN